MTKSLIEYIINRIDMSIWTMNNTQNGAEAYFEPKTIALNKNMKKKNDA